jgi:hypothetical protein
MRSPHNAASDVVNELRMTNVRETVVHEEGRWIVRFESLTQPSFLEIEVLENGVVCVLRRFHCGRRAMNRIMNKFTERLISSQSLPSPPSLRRVSRLSLLNRSESPVDGIVRRIDFHTDS